MKTKILRKGEKNPAGTSGHNNFMYCKNYDDRKKRKFQDATKPRE